MGEAKRTAARARLDLTDAMGRAYYPAGGEPAWDTLQAVQREAIGFLLRQVAVAVVDEQLEASRGDAPWCEAVREFLITFAATRGLLGRATVVHVRPDGSRETVEVEGEDYGFAPPDHGEGEA